MTDDRLLDAIVIGGSFAGLSAALQLARARRSVRILDAGRPRNRFADAAHGFFSRDGEDPRTLIAAAQAQLRRYPSARVIAAEAVRASAIEGGFEVVAGDGGVLAARKLVLAFGVNDVLPELPGAAERWGKSVLHCPYCHGYEFAGQRLGVLQSASFSAQKALLVADWGPTTLYLNADRRTAGRRAIAVGAAPGRRPRGRHRCLVRRQPHALEQCLGRTARLRDRRRPAGPGDPHRRQPPDHGRGRVRRRRHRPADAQRDLGRLRRRHCRRVGAPGAGVPAAGGLNRVLNRVFAARAAS